MTSEDIRPEAVRIAEHAAWKQMQALQRMAFENAGLLGVVELNELLIKNYRALFHEGGDPGKGELLARGLTASTFVTQLLPQIKEEMTGNALVDLLLLQGGEGNCHVADLAA